MPAGVARARSPRSARVRGGVVARSSSTHRRLRWRAVDETSTGVEWPIRQQGGGGETHRGGTTLVRWRRRASAAAFRSVRGIAVVGSEGNDALKHRGVEEGEVPLKRRRGVAVAGAHREGRLVVVSS
jgi:hypothetical protein